MMRFRIYSLSLEPKPNNLVPPATKIYLLTAVILVSEEHAMVVCDLCGQRIECFQRDIEGKRYDICSDCWSPLAKKLEGKGKRKEDQKPSLVKEAEESPTLPGDH
jgi:hypothetical protein